MQKDYNMKNKTLDYYNQNAEAFIQGTAFVDFKETQEKFIKALPGKRVLDFGCGSGRDSKFFIDAGLNVVAIDGSEEICKIASKNIGINVRQMLFQELDEVERYDGIWACSSILHLSKTELKPVLNKMITALYDNGIIYTSFKYGQFEGERNGRFFTDFTLDSFKEYISDIKNIVIEDTWITSDVRPEREEEKWLNLILRKMVF